MGVRDTKVLLFDKAQHGTLGQLVEGALTDQPFTTVIHAEEEIEHDTYQRQEKDNQHPSHRLGRLPVVHDDVDD